MLLTESYRALLEQEHKTKHWGTTAVTRVSRILREVDKTGETTILDYGSGHGAFKQYIDKNFPMYDVIEYEPGRPECSHQPEPCGYVICTDVLEHVEPECIEAVLDDLKRVVEKHGLFTISTEPAHKILKDGRNAHLIIEPASWWLEKLSQRFTIVFESHNDKGLLVLVTKK